MASQHGPKGALLGTTLIAGAAVNAGRVIKRGADASHAITNTAATIRPLGIAADSASAAEESLPVAHRPGEVVLGVSGAAVALDAEVTSDASGKLVTAAGGGTNWVVGLAREAPTATDQYFAVELVSPYLKA
jgi:hypothetical protein